MILEQSISLKEASKNSGTLFLPSVTTMMIPQKFVSSTSSHNHSALILAAITAMAGAAAVTHTLCEVIGLGWQNVVFPMQSRRDLFW
jgi:Na+/H+-dicarboxylate symporter